MVGQIFSGCAFRLIFGTFLFGLIFNSFLGLILRSYGSLLSYLGKQLPSNTRVGRILPLRQEILWLAASEDNAKVYVWVRVVVTFTPAFAVGILL